MAKIILLFSLFVAFTAEAETKYSEKLGSSEILITQTDLKADGDKFAEIDIEIKKDKKVVGRKKIFSGGSVGGHAGASILKEQPFKEAFIFKVEGDYHTRIYIIYADGTVSEIEGGGFHVDLESKTILTFAGGGAEGGYVVIYDILKKRPLIQLTDWNRVEKFIDTEENIYLPMIKNKEHFFKESKSGSSSNGKMIQIDLAAKALKRPKKTPKDFTKGARAMINFPFEKWKKL